MGAGEQETSRAVHCCALNAKARWRGRGWDKALLAHDLLCHGADAGAASRGREEDDDVATVRFASSGSHEIRSAQPRAKVTRTMEIQRSARDRGEVAVRKRRSSDDDPTAHSERATRPGSGPRPRNSENQLGLKFES